MNSLFEQMMSMDSGVLVDESQRVKEVMQQIALAGLSRSQFFAKAAFYGGTCLRLFHGLPRFSEDMDFSLLHADGDFDIEAYFPFIVEEFESMDIDISITKKDKNLQTAIESAFLKSDTAVYDIEARSKRIIKIKIEVDTQPPLGFETEDKVSVLPFSFMTKCYKLPFLYAGKMHALMYRSWKKRVKGRDWFDFEWYVRNNIPLDFPHYLERVKQLSPDAISPKSIDEFKNELREKIRITDFSLAKQDVTPFIADSSVLNIWSIDYFIQLVDLMRFSKVLGDHVE